MGLLAVGCADFCSGGGLSEAMFEGEHVFELSSLGPRAVEFSTTFVFSDLTASVITKTIPDLRPYLERSAAALKKRVEDAGWIGQEADRA